MVRRKRERTKEQADRLSKRLIIVAILIFIPALTTMNYASISSNKSLFFVSFLLALIGAIVAGWAIKVRTGRTMLGAIGAALIYTIASMLFAFTVLLTG